MQPTGYEIRIPKSAALDDSSEEMAEKAPAYCNTCGLLHIPLQLHTPTPERMCAAYLSLVRRSKLLGAKGNRATRIHAVPGLAVLNIHSATVPSQFQDLMDPFRPELYSSLMRRFPGE